MKSFEVSQPTHLLQSAESARSLFVHLRRTVELPHAFLYSNMDFVASTMVKAAAKGQIRVLEATLVEDPTAVDRRVMPRPKGDAPLYSPLLSAVAAGQIGAVKFLLSKGADPNQTLGENTVLHTLLIYGDTLKPDDLIAGIRALVEAGANVNAMGAIGTPLHLAAHYPLLDAIPVLIELGADGDLKNESTKTPAAYALKRGHRGACELIEKLLKKRQSKKAKGGDSDTDDAALLHSLKREAAEESGRPIRSVRARSAPKELA